MKKIFIGMLAGALIALAVTFGMAAQSVEKLYTIVIMDADLSDEDFNKVALQCAKDGGYGGTLYKLSIAENEPTGYFANFAGNVCIKEVNK